MPDDRKSLALVRIERAKELLEEAKGLFVALRKRS